MPLTVSQVARLTGVSVRTLHHYDEIGLLSPSARSDAGYRLYADADLERLQQVLFWRALELPLPEIARILADPAFDPLAALRLQRQLLAEREVRLRALVGAVDAAIARLERGEPMKTNDETLDDRFAVFRDFDQAKYEKEAEERWGQTEAWQESKRRTAGYTKRDWDEVKAEGGAIFQQLAALMQAGTPATATAAMDLAEAHRLHIDRRFYTCTHAFHRGLGELYVNDERFTQNIDKIAAGLARYACEAFAANAARAGTA